ncbi:MAG: ATP-binding protein [Candidatus Gastranaerophilales bacterium]|nr:ATP-binding protein [Candidatus Gastranaerophilales bacterium]
MDKNRNIDQKTHKKLERIVLGVFSIYSGATFVVAQLSGWGLITKEIVLVALAAGWLVHLRQYKSYEFRAKFLAVMSWINLVIFSVHIENLSSILSTMAGLIVLLGIFCDPHIIYMGMAVSTFVMLYHVFVMHTINLDTTNGVIGMVLQILSIYTVSGVTWILIRTQQETSEQLIENIRELELAEQSKDDFMVNVSHEIRTPINAVCGMSEAILQEELPIDVRKDVIDIQTAGRNLLATVSNILDFSELESGKLELAEESYNITSTITDIINMALTMENGKHLELIVDCDANLPSNLLGDEQKFRRVVMNLLENAIKFTREGGVILRIKGRKEEYGINLHVSIKDSGIGIKRADMEKIFTSFSQINSKRNREEGGVGLGLAISQALVNSMGGFITVESRPGIGSEFSFTIPQKVLDETPIVSIRNKKQIYATCYINTDKYNFSVVREGYESSIRHIAEQFGIMFRICKNLLELKRRIEYDKFTHVFIGWDEYCEDRKFFEELAKETTVVLILEYGQETRVGSNMLRIYKPFTVLSIAAVFNGQKIVQNDEKHIGAKYRFVAPQAKMLVVDDNAMNLKVMARLLLPYQIKVTMASGGLEALEKLDTMDFDCVFLDHMMPEMDGVETLHKIRQKPGTYFQSLPVIAFTANAIGGAREMFLSEGFTDFIAKPIELSVLERMLRRYIPAQKQIIVTESEREIASGKNVPTFKGIREIVRTDEKGNDQGGEDAEAKALAELSNAGIDIQQGMAYCGDKEGLRDIASIYHKEGPKRKAQLEQFFKEHDWKNYVITVHALKSNSKGIGAIELSELALNLEMAGKENRIDYILENHEELIEKHDALLEVFASNAFLYPNGLTDEVPEGAEGQSDKAESSADPGTQPQNSNEQPQSSDEQAGETDIEAVKKELTLLAEKLDSFESEGLEDILGRLAKCRCHDASRREIVLAELVEKIRDRVNDFDFLGAAEILSAWKEEYPI